MVWHGRSAKPAYTPSHGQGRGAWGAGSETGKPHARAKSTPIPCACGRDGRRGCHAGCMRTPAAPAIAHQPGCWPQHSPAVQWNSGPPPGSGIFIHPSLQAGYLLPFHHPSADAVTLDPAKEISAVNKWHTVRSCLAIQKNDCPSMVETRPQPRASFDSWGISRASWTKIFCHSLNEYLVLIQHEHTRCATQRAEAVRCIRHNIASTCTADTLVSTGNAHMCLLGHKTHHTFVPGGISSSVGVLRLNCIKKLLI